MTNAREPGFYWVRDTSGWLVAQSAINGKWLSPGHTEIVEDAFWQEIGQRVDDPQYDPTTQQPYSGET